MKKISLCFKVFLLASGLQILFLIGAKISDGLQGFLFASAAILTLSLGFICFTISLYIDRDWTYVIPFTAATLYLLYVTNGVFIDFFSFLLMGKNAFPRVECKVERLLLLSDYDLLCSVNGKEKKYKNPFFYNPTQNIDVLLKDHIVVILSRHYPDTILWIETPD